MKAYIDKAALVAELNRLIAELVEEGEDTMFEQGRISAFEDVKVFINHTLEVKEVNEEPVSKDLEEAVNAYIGYAPEVDECSSVYGERQAFKAGANWQKEQILLNDNNKEYHRVPSTTLKRLYMNKAKYELLKSDIMEGIVGDFEKGTTHNYLTIKIPMLLCPSNCAKGDKVKLIIIKEE